MHSTTARGILLSLGIIFSGLVACGSDQITDGDGDGRPPTPICAPRSTQACYTGPTGTLNVGVCRAGLQTCHDDGLDWGTCEGQVVPAEREICNYGILDDDCDGKTERSDCVPCEPGTRTCQGNDVVYCPDGLYPVVEWCDAPRGMGCNPATGKCEDVCSPSMLGTGSRGCDFYATVTSNFGDPNSAFGIVVTNESSESAEVTVTRGDTLVANREVPPFESQIIELPWIAELRGPELANQHPTRSARLDQGSYHVQSKRPVTVTQFSPVRGRNGSVDASLLLPTTAWGSEYRVISFGQQADIPGFYTITAGEDGTKVTTAAPPTGASIKSGVVGLSSAGVGTLTLNRGDVIQIFSGASTGPNGDDLTGALVTADKPIQVIGGHRCAKVPAVGGSTCDHLEETIFPVTMASTRHIVAGPVTTESSISDRLVRIVATSADTHLSYEPAQPDAPTSIAKAGAWVEFRTTSEFEIRADQPVHVAQYNASSTFERGFGDTSLALTIPVDRYATNYVVQMLPSFDQYTIDIIAPAHAFVNLDGELLSGFKPIGNSGYALRRLSFDKFNPDAPLQHTLSANVPFGVDVYGYEPYASHWYPAGIQSTR